jgi:hypothetical protein
LIDWDELLDLRLHRVPISGIMKIQQMIERLLAGQEQMMARTEDNQERMDTILKKMKEEFKSGQAEMRSIFGAWLMDLKDGRKETTACQEATETEPNPGIMQSIEVHQVIPKGEAAGMPIGGLRKRRRVCNLAAERCQKMT